MGIVFFLPFNFKIDSKKYLSNNESSLLYYKLYLNSEHFLPFTDIKINDTLFSFYQITNYIEKYSVLAVQRATISDICFRLLRFSIFFIQFNKC